MKPHDDLTRGRTTLLLWCLPVAALIAGGALPAARPWLWIPAFVVMGSACLINAAQCGRVHCYITGPLFLLAAAYVVLSELRVVPMNSGVFLDIVLILTVLAFLAEFPLGRYRTKSKSRN
ncbi:MAG TPA: hypothetical protein VGI19_03475 [Candidatus Cybelea sp.]|jgi:hypothetical protein